MTLPRPDGPRWSHDRTHHDRAHAAARHDPRLPRRARRRGGRRRRPRLRPRPPWSSTRARPSAGPTEVLDFLRHAGGEYTYTTELVGAERVDDAHWVAVNRLEGDFPGGVAELRYRFTLADDLITELVIAP